MSVEQLLVEKGYVTEDQLQEAINTKKVKGGLTGIILIELGYITEQQLVTVLGIYIENFMQSKEIKNVY